MTTGVPYSSDRTAVPRHTGGVRVVIAVLGVAAVVVGAILLVHPHIAARTLAVFIGLALLVGGLLELAVAWQSDHRWLAALPGFVLVLGALIAFFWPGVTLGVLVLVLGIALIVQGVGRMALAFFARAELPHWGWLALGGAFNTLVGILALAWPQVTVLVLSLILGVQVLVFGVMLVAAALWRPPVSSQLQ